MSPQEIGEIRNGLAQFTGSELFHAHWLRRFVYTDGVEYLAEKCGAYWLLDAIASWQPEAMKDGKLREIQFWRLVVKPARAPGIPGLPQFKCLPANNLNPVTPGIRPCGGPMGTKNHRDVEGVEPEASDVMAPPAAGEDRRTAVLYCDRDANDVAFKQEIPFTDFPLEAIQLYLSNGVLLLPSEY